MTAGNALRGKCGCGHIWVVAHLPMELVKAAQLAKRAACPKCGSMKDIKVATGADVSSGESAA